MDLIETKKIDAVELFSGGGLEPLLISITDKVAKFVPDLKTESGRKELSTLAKKINRSKTYLDDLGKELVSDRKKEVKTIDIVRQNMRARLDKLKDETRAPLTEYEEKEKIRVVRLNIRMNELKELEVSGSIHGINAEEIKVFLDKISDLVVGEDWQEYKGQVLDLKRRITESLTSKYEYRKVYEEQQKEIRLMKEAEEARKKREYEDEIRLEAQQKATKEANEKSQIEAEKREHDKLTAIREKEDAEKREMQARIDAAESRAKREQEKREAMERLERERKESAIKLEEEKQLAVEKEKARVEAEQVAIKEAIRKREENLKHCKKIEKDITTALIKTGVNEKQSKQIFVAIKDGLIPHAHISF